MEVGVVVVAGVGQLVEATLNVVAVVRRTRNVTENQVRSYEGFTISKN